MSKHRWTVGGGALTRFVSAFALLVATPARADEVGRWRSFVEEASARFGVPASWIERVMYAESRGHATANGRPIRSSAGAMGLMQLMPATWAEMRARLSLGNNPDDPHDNILAGALYLRLMYDQFGYPGVFGAYNAGPRTYAAYLASARRLPGETVAYMRTVAGTAPKSAGAMALPSTQVTRLREPRSASAADLPPASPAPKPALFFVHRAVTPSEPATSSDDRQASLFAVRNVAP